MGMRPVPVGQDRYAKLAITIAEEACCVAGHAAAVSEVGIAAALVQPRGQAGTSGRCGPNALAGSFELLVLGRGHLIEHVLADNPLALNRSTVQIHNQPVCLVEDCAVDKTRGPD